MVPAWAACYALPLTARPGVRGGLCFRTPPKLITPCLPPIHYYHLPPLLQMCLSPLPPPPICPPPTLPCPGAHYYFIVWFCIPFTPAVVEGRPLGLLLTHVRGSLPQREETKQQEGDSQSGPRHLNSPHLELIVGGQSVALCKPCASRVSICRDINRY